MRRLPLVALLLLCVATSGCAAAATAGAPTRRYHSPLGWSLTYPSAWHVERSRSPSYIRIDVREATVASFPLLSPISGQQSPSGASMHIDAPRDPANKFPANGVAFRVLLQQGGPPVVKKPRETRFPLRLATFRRQEGYGSQTPQPVGRVINVGGQLYLVQAWIGPRASRTARAKLARVVSSLSFRR
jgi:hypothetical protein